jgi:DNA helicase-2/ATP-dependent DNA helicase PcrA
MLAGTYVERLTHESSAGVPPATQRLARPEGAQRLEGSRPLSEPERELAEEDSTQFDPLAFDFGDSTEDTSFAFREGAESEISGEEQEENTERAGRPLDSRQDAGATDDGAFRAPGGPANTAEVLKFLIDRTQYIKLLEDEDTPEAYSRIENLRELVNAALDSKDRGETLEEFLDHAALVSDADGYDESARITLMTLHAAKGLEFPLVFLCGLEEGLFPHSRTLLEMDDIEEERRLCYVGMTRAMDTLILSRAVYRRRYGTDLPEASVPSRFLEEVPAGLVEELGGSRRRPWMGSYSASPRTGSGAQRRGSDHDEGSSHYSYEDEDQSANWQRERAERAKPTYSGKSYNSIDNIAEFFASRGKKFNLPKTAIEEPKGKKGFRPGQKVRHPKYGEGTVYQREGDGEDAKITVQFPRFGLKKLVEKYAQLEKA